MLARFASRCQLERRPICEKQKERTSASKVVRNHTLSPKADSVECKTLGENRCREVKGERKGANQQSLQ